MLRGRPRFTALMNSVKSDKSQERENKLNLNELGPKKDDVLLRVLRSAVLSPLLRGCCCCCAHSAAEKYFPSGGRKSPSFVYQQKRRNRINTIQPVLKNCFVDPIFIHEYWVFQFGEAENAVFS